MITGLELLNFKAFSHLPQLDIGPITILCGTNSSGKSSILQSILLLKQTMTNGKKNQQLVLDGKYTNLGTLKSMLFQNDVKSIERMGISLRFQTADNTDQQNNKKLEIEFTSVNNQPTIYKIEKYESSELQPILSIKLIDKERSIYEVRSRSYTEPCYAKITEIKEILPQFLIFYELERFTPMGTFKYKREIESISQTLRQELKDLFDSIHYIGPFREIPLRRYTRGKQIDDIGIKGETAPIILEAEALEYVPEYYLRENVDSTNPFIKQLDHTLAQAVEAWMDVLGIPGLNASTYQELVSLEVLSSSNPKQRVNIADIGFGFSQVFPIVLEGLRMPIGNTLLLEQPEIHLHPLMQMDLADYILAMALSGKRFIIETHSEHMINRLVKRIVQNEGSKIDDLLAVYFITPHPDGSEVEEIEVNETIGIVNWPKNFFDQAACEKEEIFWATMRRNTRIKGSEDDENSTRS